MSVEKITIHVGEVRELLNSPGVVAELRRHCDEAAERCNDAVRWHSPMRDPAYKAVVDNGRYTAVGKVVMNGLGKDGNAVAAENAAHNTLLKGSGW